VSRVLLVTPVFHQYHRAISAAIEANGHEVVTHLYDRDGGLAGKIENRLIHVSQLGIRNKLRGVVTQRAITALANEKPDLVVVVKADVLGDAWWEALNSSGTPYVLWIYDELGNTSFEIDALCQLRSVVSYSATDTTTLQSVGIDAGYVPGGFDSFETVQSSAGLEKSLVFIGARYSQREALLNQLQADGIDLRVYGGQWGSSLWDKARTGNWQKTPFPTGPDLARGVSYGVMQNALASINHHGSHTGFNMRMFEACGVGGVHLVDRTDVSEFYEPNEEIFVFTDAAEAAEVVAKLKADSALAARVRKAARQRTLAEHTLTNRMAHLLARVS